MRLELYPKNLLSIAYFVRHACSLGNKEEIRLVLTLCKLSYIEFKALIQELSKPALKYNVILDLSFIYISKTLLQLFKALFSPQCCIAGFTICGHCIEDNDLALKQIIEGIYVSSAKESSIRFAPSCFRFQNVHHLILLVQCDSLRTLKLSSPLFGHYRFSYVAFL